MEVIFAHTAFQIERFLQETKKKISQRVFSKPQPAPEITAKVKATSKFEMAVIEVLFFVHFCNYTN